MRWATAINECRDRYLPKGEQTSHSSFRPGVGRCMIEKQASVKYVNETRRYMDSFHNTPLQPHYYHQLFCDFSLEYLKVRNV